MRLVFCGHDEGKNSQNQRNFRKLLAWLADNFEEVNRVVLGNDPFNCQMIDHKIQKQFIVFCAHETTKFIIEELGDECFAILADESSAAYHQLHTIRNNWLFACDMLIKKENLMSGFLILCTLRILHH
jgi:hypothetical protein